MTRIVKPPDERRSELVDIAQNLFYSQGYSQTAIKDIVQAASVAQGTFYYYFDSKKSILEAIVDKNVKLTQEMLHEIVTNETLTALQKWQQVVQASGNWKVSRKEEMLEIYRIIMRDENVLIQHKMQKKTSQMTAKELAYIITEGVEEGIFATTLIPATAEIVVAILDSFSRALGELLLEPEKYNDPITLAEEKGMAVQRAIEQILGAAPGSLPIIDEEILTAWFAE